MAVFRLVEAYNGISEDRRAADHVMLNLFGSMCEEEIFKGYTSGVPVKDFVEQCELLVWKQDLEEKFEKLARSHNHNSLEIESTVKQLCTGGETQDNKGEGGVCETVWERHKHPFFFHEYQDKMVQDLVDSVPGGGFTPPPGFEGMSASQRRAVKEHVEAEHSGIGGGGGGVKSGVELGTLYLNRRFKSLVGARELSQENSDIWVAPADQARVSKPEVVQSRRHSRRRYGTQQTDSSACNDRDHCVLQLDYTLANVFEQPVRGQTDVQWETGVSHTLPPGFDLVVRQMQEGDHWLALVPPDKGYAGVPTHERLPPFSYCLFDVKIKKTIKLPAPRAAEKAKKQRRRKPGEVAGGNAERSEL